MKQEIIYSEKKVLSGKAVITTTTQESFSADELRNRIMICDKQMSDIVAQMKLLKAKYDELLEYKNDLISLHDQLIEDHKLPEIPEGDKDVK